MLETSEKDKNLQAALDSVHVGTFEWDLSRRTLQLSRAAEWLWGWQPGEFNGTYEAFASRLHPPDRARLEAQLDGFAGACEPLRLDVRVLRANGELSCLELRGELHAAGREPAGVLRGSILGVDTTALRERDQELDRLGRLYRAISSINQAIVSTKTREDLFSKICHALTAQAGFSLAWIGIHDAGAAEVIPVAASGEDLVRYADFKIKLSEEAEARGPSATAFAQNQPYISNDTSTDPATQPWRVELERGGYRSMGSFPVRELGVGIGLLNVYDRRVGAFGPREIALLEEAANDISFALDRVREEERRVEAERRLRQERDFSDAVLQSLPGILYLYDESGKFLRWNKNFEKVSGYSAAEIKTLQPLDFFTGPESELVAERIAEVFASGHSNVEAMFKGKNGSGLPYQFTGVKTEIEGEPCLIGVGIDVSERHRAEQARLASEKLYRALFEHAPDGILIADGESVYRDANPSACQMLGYSVEELVGLGAADILAEGELARVAEALQTIKAGVHFHQEWLFRRKDGTVFPAEVRATLMPDGNLLAMLRDITERKQAEARLRDQEALLRLAGRAAKLGGWSIDLPSFQGAWSDEVCTIYEVPFGTRPSAEEALCYCAPEFEETVRRKVQKCADSGEPFDLELQIVTANKRRVWVRGIGLPEFDGRGAVKRLVGAIQDIDDQRKLEEQLRQAQKMEAVGHLAGGVAHDFNNILSVILGYTDLILEDMAEADSLRADIEEISLAGKRAKELTSKLLTFSRRDMVEVQVLDMGQVVRGMESMVRRLIGSQIELSIITDFSAGKVLGDPGQIEQVIMNLAINARDAMPEGGKLSIETVDTTLDASYCADHLGVVPGPYLMLAVTDTGIGMDAATKDRIFEPFFTTKAPGKGTGLGLATVFGILQQSRGHIAVYSEPDRGTTFMLYFPRTDRVAREAVAATPPVVTLRGTETVLLVEDDEAVRTLMATILRRQGYFVVEAANGAEALLVSEQLTSKLHLLITDLLLPRVGGRRLAEQLSEGRSDLCTLFVSGSTEDGTFEQGEFPRTAFLAKPIGPNDLLCKVRELLNSVAAVA